VDAPSARSPGDSSSTGRWCECPDAPVYVRGPATYLDHPGECEFPGGTCTVRAHRVTVHEKCGRELAVRFCGCLPSGYSFDPERGWWVHYLCGWPKKAWYEGAGRSAPDHLVGIRPVTYHEYLGVSRGPKSKTDPLTRERRRQNDALIGSWVRD
jgi:hypothetical protein